jgi:glutamate-5-semialdehyde dehydrogenase
MTEQTHIDELVTSIAKEALAASRILANVPTPRKNVALLKLAEVLERRSAEIIEANARDVEAAKVAGLSSAMVDRLMLDASRIGKMAVGVRQIAELPDPVARSWSATIAPRSGYCKVRVPSV